MRLQTRLNLRAGQDLVHAPAVGVAHVHVFDEAQFDPSVEKVPGHGDNLVVVHALLNHHVDLDRGQPHPQGCIDAVQHLAHGDLAVAHAAKGGVIQRVQADGDALKAGVLQGLNPGPQQGAVGGERQLGRGAFCRAQRCQPGNEVIEVLAHQGLSARQTQFAHTQLQKESACPFDFFEGEQGLVRHEAVPGAIDLPGHAIAAAEVAAVGHRDAQITKRAAQGVQRGDGAVARRQRADVTDRWQWDSLSGGGGQTTHVGTEGLDRDGAAFRHGPHCPASRACSPR